MGNTGGSGKSIFSRRPRLYKNKIITGVSCLYALFIVFTSAVADLRELNHGDFFNKVPRQNYRLPVSWREVKSLSRIARVIAQRLLSRDPKDKKGIFLLKFSCHLNPDDKDALLLRGKLKYNVKIKTPTETDTVEEFVGKLIQIAKHPYKSENALARHFNIVVCQMIRLFNPGNEDAIVTLISYEDQGMDIDLNKLLEKRLDSTIELQYDSNDPRYIVSNVEKTVEVPASQPWTETWVKVKEGKIIRVRARNLWSMGGGAKIGRRIPSYGADGLVGIDIDALVNGKKSSATTAAVATAKTNKIQKSALVAHPGCLLARIGSKEYVVGSEAIFRAESSGILHFGPYEWGDYSDNMGRLSVMFQISDK